MRRAGRLRIKPSESTDGLLIGFAEEVRQALLRDLRKATARGELMEMRRSMTAVLETFKIQAPRFSLCEDSLLEARRTLEHALATVSDPIRLT